VVANHPSGFFVLAAAPRQPLAVAAWPTSPRKTRVGVFRHRSSGQTSSRRRCRSMFTPGSRGCGYKTVSGRHEWPNRDPIQEFGGLNLYAYVFNNPINWIDLYGLSFSGRFGNGLVGAGAGAITGGGVGAVAGLGFGDEATIPAGALAGAIAGFVAGFLSDPCFNPLKAAGTGAIHGGLAGIVGVAGEVGGVLWGAGAGLGIGGISGGLATGGDPRGIAGGAIIGVFSGGLGAGASELGPLTAGVFYGASEAGGQEFGELMNILR